LIRDPARRLCIRQFEGRRSAIESFRPARGTAAKTTPPERIVRIRTRKIGQAALLGRSRRQFRRPSRPAPKPRGFPRRSILDLKNIERIIAGKPAARQPGSWRRRAKILLLFNL
jgi:hypothetical protein